MFSGDRMLLSYSLVPPSTPPTHPPTYSSPLLPPHLSTCPPTCLPSCLPTYYLPPTAHCLLLSRPFRLSNPIRFSVLLLFRYSLPCFIPSFVLCFVSFLQFLPLFMSSNSDICRFLSLFFLPRLFFISFPLHSFVPFFLSFFFLHPPLSSSLISIPI